MVNGFAPLIILVRGASRGREVGGDFPYQVISCVDES